MKILNKQLNEVKDLEAKVCENLVAMFPKSWEIVEEVEEPKKKRKTKEEETNKDPEMGE